MMRKMVLSLAALALVAAPALAKEGKYNKVVSPGDPAPSFSGIPAISGDKEEALSLDGVKEDVVVLVFLANHCPVVTAYEDWIIDFAKDYKGKVKVIGVCVSDSPIDRLPAIKDRVKEKGYNYSYAFDASQKIGRDYGASATPQFFVIDKDRTIRYTGAMDDSQSEGKVKKTYLKDAVDAVLAGKDVTVAETKPSGCGVQYKK